MRGNLPQVSLTFDVEGLPPHEDVFDNYSLMCITKVLDLLDERNLRGIFFITGYMAEQIRKYLNLVERLGRHEIGYHSSIHSTRPIIIEYTDVPSYEEAMTISLEREVSHIDPETGQIIGDGGILALRETFPKKRILCFRAPFLAWSPPHLEALKKLGILFDFSSSLSDFPVRFKGITFFPSPISIDDGMEATFIHREPKGFFPRPINSITLRRKVTVLSLHPGTLLIKNIYAGRGNYQLGGNARTKFLISLLRLFFYRIHLLQRNNLIEVTLPLGQNWQPVDLEKVRIGEIYQQSVQGVKRLFNLDSQFIFSHFMHFFFDNGKVDAHMHH